VKVCADDPSTTCFLPEINPLLFKMMMDSDEKDNLYMSPPLTPIELDTPVPFPAAKLMTQSTNLIPLPPSFLSPKKFGRLMPSRMFHRHPLK
jgi:hypothetical protein